MWTFLLGLIPSVFTTINGITNAIANAKIAAINATTDQERIRAEEEVATLQAQRDVLIEDSKHSNLDIWIRTIIALGPTVVLLKIFIWDKVLEWGSTSIGNSDKIWDVVMVVLGFYFVSSIAAMFRK